MRTSTVLVLLLCLIVPNFFTAAHAADNGAAAQLELRFWDDVTRMNTLEAYEAYLKAYPTGTFTSLARINIRQLQQSPQPPSPESSAPPSPTAVPGQQASSGRFAVPAIETASKGSCVRGDCSNGIGTFDYANGDRYIGNFQRSRKHGQGEYHYANGTVYEGEFKNGAAIGQGTIHYPDGSRYVGWVDNGRMAGQGTLYLSNGSTISGDWGQGQLHSD